MHHVIYSLMTRSCLNVVTSNDCTNEHLFCCYVRLPFFTSVNTSATLELQE